MPPARWHRAGRRNTASLNTARQPAPPGRSARLRWCGCSAGAGRGSRVLFLLLLFGILFEALSFFSLVVLFGLVRTDCGRRRRGARRFCKLDSAGRRALAARLIKLAVLYQQSLPFTGYGIECLKQIIADQRAAGRAPPPIQSTEIAPLRGSPHADVSTGVAANLPSRSRPTRSPRIRHWDPRAAQSR
jgi:hypothetical protein